MWYSRLFNFISIKVHSISLNSKVVFRESVKNKLKTLWNYYVSAGNCKKICSNQVNIPTIPITFMNELFHSFIWNDFKLKSTTKFVLYINNGLLIFLIILIQSIEAIVTCLLWCRFFITQNNWYNLSKPVSCLAQYLWLHYDNWIEKCFSLTIIQRFIFKCC